MADLDEPLDDEEFAALFGDEPIARPRRTGLRVAAAVLLVGLVLLLVLRPGGWIVRRSSSARAPSGIEAVVEDASPSTVATVPGAPGRALSETDWEIQEGATVLVGTTAPRCSGAITEIDGVRFVTSARHCLGGVLPDDVVSAESGQVQEVTGSLTGPLDVFDPTSHLRIATLDRIAVGTGETDYLVATTKDETSTFRGKPARFVDRLPAVGDEVATYASSGASGFRPQRLNGVYLGTHSFRDDDGHVLTVDLVGYRQPSSSTLVSEGHSGHSPTGAGGTAFGPLLFSVNGHTPADERAEDLRSMSGSTGIDLAAEGFVSIDEALRLEPADHLRFAEVLRG